MSEHDEEQKPAEGEELEFLTFETKTGKLDPTDEAVMRSAKSGEGLIKLTPELLEELARAAAETKKIFDEELPDIMTPERAAYVRRLRVDEGYSWRAVASACHEAWGGDWLPPSNQIMGISICESAARHFGEDAWQAPWN